MFIYSCSIHWIKVVGNLFEKAYGENLIIEKTYVVGTHLRQFKCVPRTYVSENRETFLKLTLTENHDYCLFAFNLVVTWL